MEELTIKEVPQQSIDLTPRGMATPEGCQRVTESQERLEDTTAQFANACAEFFDNWRDELLAFKQYMAATDRQAFGEELHQIEALHGSRQRATESFLRAVAGVK